MEVTRSDPPGPEPVVQNPDITASIDQQTTLAGTTAQFGVVGLLEATPAHEVRRRPTGVGGEFVGVDGAEVAQQMSCAHVVGRVVTGDRRCQGHPG